MERFCTAEVYVNVRVEGRTRLLILDLGDQCRHLRHLSLRVAHLERPQKILVIC